MHHLWKNFSKTLTVFLFLFMYKNNVQISAEEYATSDPNLNSNQQVEIQDDKQIQMAKRAWKQLQNGWGKRVNFQDPDEPLKTFQNDEYLDYDIDTLQQPKVNIYNENEDAESLEKRAWKQMNGAWGKREPNWNKFRGKMMLIH